MIESCALKKFAPLSVMLGVLLYYQFAIAAPMQEYTLKAALALNLARFTEWPASTLKPGQTQVTLCVFANHAAQQAFIKLNQKKIGERTLNVDVLMRLGDVSHCHLLFISNLSKNKTIQLLSGLQQQAILTIGEENYFTEYGGIVDLQMQQGKMGIRINVNAAKRAGLNISSRVLKLATIVE